jgi:hypothetical protein
MDEVEQTLTKEQIEEFREAFSSASSTKTAMVGKASPLHVLPPCFLSLSLFQFLIAFTTNT